MIAIDRAAIEALARTEPPLSVARAAAVSAARVHSARTFFNFTCNSDNRVAFIKQGGAAHISRMTLDLLPLPATADADAVSQREAVVRRNQQAPTTPPHTPILMPH